MKRVSTVVLITTFFGLTACAAGTVNTKADSTESGAAKSTSAKVGEPVTIKGNEDGSKIQVIAKKVVGTTKSTDGFMEADAGNRIAAVRFSFVNTGTIAYDDAPCNGAKLVDKKGQQYDCDITFSKIAAGPMLPAAVKLSPGNKALGFLAFQVPANVKIAQVQFSQDSGFGETAQWDVR